MATLTKSLVLVLLADFFIVYGENTETCEGFCQNTYPLHTYPEPSNLCSCTRGCRLFTIIDIIEANKNINETRKSCIDACSEAYPSEGNKAACELGCQRQAPFNFDLPSFSPLGRMIDDPFNSPIMGSMMHVENMFGNMMRHMGSMSFSWTMYSDNGQGSVVAVFAQPSDIMRTDDDQLMMVNLDPAQLEDMDGNGRLSVRDMSAGKSAQEDQGWMQCVAKRLRVHHFTLGLICLFLSVFLFCTLLSTCGSTKGKIEYHPQKLLFKDELPLLKEGSDVIISCPQAPPLPHKVPLDNLPQSQL